MLAGPQISAENRGGGCAYSREYGKPIFKIQKGIVY